MRDFINDYIKFFKFIFLSDSPIFDRICGFALFVVINLVFSLIVFLVFVGIVHNPWAVVGIAFFAFCIYAVFHLIDKYS